MHDKDCFIFMLEQSLLYDNEFYSEYEFRKAWNHRAHKLCKNVISELPAYSNVEGAFSCSNCGFTITDHDEFELLSCFPDRTKDNDEEYSPDYSLPKWKYCPNCGARVINSDTN